MGSALMGSALLGGCSLAPHYERPSTAAAAGQYQELPQSDDWKLAEPLDDMPRGAWWSIFKDPKLDQLEDQLPAAGVRLSGDVLDRIDEIVAPGTDVNPEDGAWTPPALSDARLRRRLPTAP